MRAPGPDEQRLADSLRASPRLRSILERLASVALPAWYLGAGCIAQTHWNVAHGKPPDADILDWDVAYFEEDGSEVREEARLGEVRRALAPLGSLGDVKLDVKNQARVHFWYERRFGRHIEPFRSVEEAIATWPTTASAVGVRLAGEDLFVFAPYGLGDLLGLVVRANRALVSRDVYEAKAARWRERWPLLRILPWSDGLGEPREEGTR